MKGSCLLRRRRVARTPSRAKSLQMVLSLHAGHQILPVVSSAASALCPALARCLLLSGLKRVDYSFLPRRLPATILYKVCAYSRCYGLSHNPNHFPRLTLILHLRFCSRNIRNSCSLRNLCRACLYFHVLRPKALGSRRCSCVCHSLLKLLPLIVDNRLLIFVVRVLSHVHYFPTLIAMLV